MPSTTNAQFAVIKFCVFVAVFSGAAISLHAQQGRGAIFGTVVDPGNAVIAGTKITVTNVATGGVFSTQTNESGFYTVPILNIGAYKVEAEHVGFKKEIRSGIEVEVGKKSEVDFQLDLGALTQSVEVHANAPMVNTADSTVGTLVEGRRLQDLPIDGRSAFALMLITPGVIPNSGPTDEGFDNRGTSLTAVSINGSPIFTNNFMIDGNNNANAFYPDMNVNPAVDAIQEFKVESNTMSAEFGLTLGGVVNVVTKSGTNTFHGTLYEFLRNDKLDARNAFAATRTPYRYNQFGGAVGGPVVFPKIYDGRDRTFFFFNYEEYRYRQTVNPIFSVPTAQERAGDFSQDRSSSCVLIPIYDPATTQPNPSGSGYARSQFFGNVIPSVKLDHVSNNFLQFYPLPNLTPSNPCTNANNAISSIPNIYNSRQYTIRGDQHVSAKNSLALRYIYYLHAPQNASVSYPLPDHLINTRIDRFDTKNAVLSDTHTFSPSLLNELRVGMSRQVFTFITPSYGGNWPQKLGLPSTVPPDFIPRVSNGLPPFNSGTRGVRGSLTWDLYDGASLVRGRHSLKFGAQIRLVDGSNFQTSNPSGSFSFPAGLTGNPLSPAGTGDAFATFMAGAVGSANATTHLGVSEVGYSTSYFTQDDWRVTRRFTLNLGLRYDYQQPPYERRGGTSNFNLFATNPDNGLPGRMQYALLDFGRSVIEANKNDWGPRVGFAYDVFGNGRTAFRGGYGVFYSNLFSYYTNSFGSSSGFATATTTYNPPNGNTNYPAFQFSNGLPYVPTPPLGSRLGPSAFITGSESYQQPIARTPQSQQWTFSVQRQLPGAVVLDIAYSGNKGTHLLAGGWDLNQLDPQYETLGLSLQNTVPNPYMGRVPGTLGGATITRAQSLRPYPYLFSVNTYAPDVGNSIYHALFVTVEKRFSTGFTVLGSYTHGKLISDNVLLADYYTADPTGYQNGYDRKAERAVDPMNVSDRFVLSALYELPFGTRKRWSSSSRFINGWISGWEVTTISTVSAGLPLVIRGANNFLADRPNSVGRSANLSHRTAQEWFDTTAFVNPPAFTFGNVGRTLPDVTSPGIVNLDLSLIKDTYLRESLRLQFRAEAFNATNSVHLLAPDTTFVPGANGSNISSTFGTITSARDARIVQLALKLIW